ncbi:hypothetical protein ES332_D07G220500v1 [Gossypium tomentosum]|uniref:Uncharacterized protein n=1 Tax=Gossypium tomentosum TaxID=34277 RepID=A0A5D2K9L1_GOSTO|nr:hypothetical protein ES332_D07G220500v1 [Gossypium tomentosum]
MFSGRHLLSSFQTSICSESLWVVAKMIQKTHGTEDGRLYEGL